MLTDTLIRKAKTPDKPTKLMDGRGLFMLLTPSGGRWWRFRYAFAGKEKLLSFGIYPDVLLKEAREARDDARKLLAKGIDPSAARREERRAQREAADNDFETIAREWLENVKPGWAAVYHGDTLKRFETFVFPTISRHPIASVTPPVLLSLLRKIEARGTLVTAHKVLRACGQTNAWIPSQPVPRRASDDDAGVRKIPRHAEDGRARRGGLQAQAPKGGSGLWPRRVDWSGLRKPRTFRAPQQRRHRHGEYLIRRPAELRVRSAASLALAEAS